MFGNLVTRMIGWSNSRRFIESGRETKMQWKIEKR